MPDYPKEPRRYPVQPSEHPEYEVLPAEPVEPSKYEAPLTEPPPDEVKAAKSEAAAKRAEVRAEKKVEKEADRKKHPKNYVKVGDRARFLRNAATSWEMGVIESYDGRFGVAQLDNGDKVGFGDSVPPAWEPA